MTWEKVLHACKCNSTIISSKKLFEGNAQPMRRYRGKNNTLIIFTFTKNSTVLTSSIWQSNILCSTRRIWKKIKSKEKLTINMKVSEQNCHQDDQLIIPPIAFECSSMPKDDKSKQLTLKLRINPLTADSRIYELIIV